MGPIDILQSYLDEAADALLSGDWATYLDGISLPWFMINPSTSTVITQEADLRAEFDAFHARLKGHRVTHYLKLVDHAYFLEKDLISGYYMSHILVAGHRLIPSFRSLLDLRREGGRWRAAAMTNDLSASQWPLPPADLSAQGQAQTVAERPQR